MTSGERIYRGLLAIDAELAKHGVHAMTDFWRKETERFYLSPSAREWTACVGRGGIKSVTIVKSAIAETLYSATEIPPGERHYFAIVSENLSEASKTEKIAEKYFALLGIKTKRTDDALELVDEPRGIRVLACRVGAVSGFRCYGWAADECAKWKDADTGANPAQEVISSIRAMTVTHGREARGRMFSSPLAKSGTFYDSLARGTTPTSIVSRAPTWVANPSVSEAETHALEPDTRIWRREYAAEPQAGALSAFDVEAVDACFADRGPLPKAILGTPQIIIDASSGKSDSWTWGSFRWVVPHDRHIKTKRVYKLGAGWVDDDVLDEHDKPLRVEAHDTFRPFFRLDWATGVDGKFWNQTSAEAIVATVVRHMRGVGACRVIGDQREAFALRSLFAAHDVPFLPLAWTEKNKAQAVEKLRFWMREKILHLPHERVPVKPGEPPKTRPHEKLRRELLDFEEKILPSGSITFKGRGSRHDDYVALLITAAIAVGEGCFSLGPRRYVPPHHVVR